MSQRRRKQNWQDKLSRVHVQPRRILVAVVMLERQIKVTFWSS